MWVLLLCGFMGPSVFPTVDCRRDGDGGDIRLGPNPVYECTKPIEMHKNELYEVSKPIQCQQNAAYEDVVLHQ